METVPKCSCMDLPTLYGKITSGHIALSSAIWQKHTILGMFAELHEVPIRYLTLVWQYVSVRLPLARFPWNLGAFVNVYKIEICWKTGKNIGQFPWKPKYVSLLPVTLNRYTSSLLKWTKWYQAVWTAEEVYTLRSHSSRRLVTCTLRISFGFHKIFRTALIKRCTCMVEVLLHNAEGPLPPKFGRDTLHSYICYQSSSTRYTPISATEIWLSRATVPSGQPKPCRAALHSNLCHQNWAATRYAPFPATETVPRRATLFSRPPKFGCAAPRSHWATETVPRRATLLSRPPKFGCAAPQ